MSQGAGAALFDMDGTLVDREPLAAQAVAAVFDANGWQVGSLDLDVLVGRAWQDVHRELEVKDRLGWTEARFVDAVVAMADELVASGYELPALPGVVELIGALRDRGVPLAVVTGSTLAEVESSLGPLGLLESFASVVSAEDNRFGKPAPDP
jgi:sugar-phosphatase